MWRALVWGGPVAVAFALGNIFGFWGIGLGFAFIWLGFCIFEGTILLEQQQYVVIERLGKYQAVYFRGWNIRVIGVDHVRGEIGDTRAKEYELYADDPSTKIDFNDGASAPVVVKIWYRIGNPKDAVLGRENWRNLSEAVKLWTYTYEKPEKRVYALVDGELRPRLQALSVDAASKERDDIGNETMRVVAPELAKIGAYAPSDHKLLVIEDIALPQSVINLRQKVLEGEKLASQQEAEAVGYWKAILAIKTNLDITTDEARRIYETQRGLGTIRETKPKMTLIGRDVRGILGTLNLGEEGDRHE